MMFFVCLMLVHIIESVKQMVLEKRAAQENYIFPENLLFESEAGSAIGCARICWKTPACVMFTVTVTSLGTTCRGHAVVMTSASQGNWTASTSMYITSNLGKWTVKPFCQNHRLKTVCVCVGGFTNKWGQLSLYRRSFLPPQFYHHPF